MPFLNVCGYALGVLLVALGAAYAEAQRYDTQLIGGADLVYSSSFNQPPGFERDYTLQPSVNGRTGIMQSDIGIIARGSGIQASVVIQQGWFADANYTGDDRSLRYLQQAWLGVDLSNDFTLRAGIMPSHIGYESINARDNALLSRLFCSDATPYFETGASLQWKASSALTAEVLALNGWQRIVATNRDICYGSRLVYRPDSTITVNWSTFYGNMNDRSLEPSMRLYNNFWAEWMPVPEVQVVGIFDVGTQQLVGGSTARTWCAALVGSWRPSPNWRIASRIEHFSDPSSLLFAAPAPTGFSTTSLSANIDWEAQRSLTLRAELRGMFAASPIFRARTGVSAQDVFVTFAASYRISR